MRDIEDLITDIASIVSSCKPGERMTIDKIERHYRSIYNTCIPYHKFGYSNMENLLEAFPQYFKFSLIEGSLIISTPTKNNITDLIANEKVKSRNIGNQSNSIYKKHRKDFKPDIELPAAMIKKIINYISQLNEPIHKSLFLEKFKEYSCYEIKYKMYGFENEEHLFNYLGNNVFLIKHNMIHYRPVHNKTIYELIGEVLSKDTGFSLGLLQDRISEMTLEPLNTLMRKEGLVNFVDIIYQCCHKKIACYDFHLIYPYPSDARLIKETTNILNVKTKLSLYPPGINYIRIHSITSPSKFYFEILSNESYYSRQLIHSKLQEAVTTSPLLINFQENRICCVEYDGIWYRARISDICESRNQEFVRVHFMDHPMHICDGIEICLPTDRLRFLPHEFESIPAFFHRGSLAYIHPIDSTNWCRESCDLFKDLVLDPNVIRLEAYFVSQNPLSVIIDIMSVKENLLNQQLYRESIFYRLVDDNLAIAKFADSM